MKGKANENHGNFRIAHNDQTDAPGNVVTVEAAHTVEENPRASAVGETGPGAPAALAEIYKTEAPPTIDDTTTAAANGAGPDRDDALELEGEAADLAYALPAFEPKLNTLKGNASNHIADLFKANKKPWEKMSEFDQKGLIISIDFIAASMVTAIVNIVAARGFKHYEVKIGKFTGDREKDLVEVKAVGRLEKDFLDSLSEDTSCMIVFRNSETFYSDAKRKLEPTNIGDLGLPVPVHKTKANGEIHTVADPKPDAAPTSGPGTPTPPAVMDAVGKGPEAAEAAAAAAAVVTAEQAPPAQSTTI